MVEEEGAKDHEVPRWRNLNQTSDQRLGNLGQGRVLGAKTNRF